MLKKEVLDKLYSFRGMDKYATFGKAQPGIIHSPDDQQDIISNILDNCCKELIIEFDGVKRISKTTLRTIIIKHMDMITQAHVNNENKDFGYHLCFFLAEKTGVDIRRHSDTKIWGYWKVEGNKLKTVTRIRRSKQ